MGFFVTLAVVVGGALYFLDERSGGIDRSTPEIVTDQFLDAALVLKDPARVSLYVCDDWSAAQAMQEVDAPTDPRVSSFWGDPTVQAVGQRATVTVRVVYRVYVNSRLQQQVQLWTLDLVDDGGWRVCGLEKESSLDP